MTPRVIAIVVTVLAAVVVVLTRVRLVRRGGEVAGRLSIPRSLLDTHTVAGVLAVAVWAAFLVTRSRVLGLGGLVLWWVVTVAGLLILARWVPAKGRHSSAPVTDSWGHGPALSTLAHVGMLVGVAAWTWLLVLGKI